MADEIKNPPFPFKVSEISFTQPVNCCSHRKDEEENLHIVFHDGGGGSFYTLATSEFSINNDDNKIEKLKELCDLICKNNDLIEEEEHKKYKEDRNSDIKEKEDVREIPF